MSEEILKVPGKAPAKVKGPYVQWTKEWVELTLLPSLSEKLEKPTLEFASCSPNYQQDCMVVEINLSGQAPNAWSLGFRLNRLKLENIFPKFGFSTRNKVSDDTLVTLYVRMPLSVDLREKNAAFQAKEQARREKSKAYGEAKRREYRGT